MDRPADRELLLPLLAAAITIVGSIGPWVALHGVQIQAFEGSRRIVSIAAAIAGAIVFFAGQNERSPRRLPIAICGIACAAVSGRRFVQLITHQIRADLGWGMWVSLVGSVLLFAVALVPRARG